MVRILQLSLPPARWEQKTAIVQDRETSHLYRNIPHEVIEIKAQWAAVPFRKIYGMSGVKRKRRNNIFYFCRNDGIAQCG
jgi:hypothetical protein